MSEMTDKHRLGRSACSQKKKMTTYKEIMLDLETLGTGVNASITSIGAVRFNLEDIETFESINSNPERLFFRLIRLDKLEGDIDGSTVGWWMQQKEEARRQFITTSSHRTTDAALSEFLNFYNESNEYSNMWGNGIAFDNVIILNALKRHNLTKFWSYRSDRDVRTIKYLAQLKEPQINLDNMERHGIYHCAVDDAINQIITVQAAWRILNDRTNKN